jgi:hypothetical protein
MAAAITTVTKTASVVKTTKGSEKKWSEILSMNRRHDLQLPLDLAKFDTELKRSFHSYQRQKHQTERLWAHKHETWYQDDFIFRTHLLKQLKPITRRFKHIESLSSNDDQDQQQKNEILNDDEMENLSLKKKDKKSKTIQKELPPLKQTRKRSVIRHFQTYAGDEPRPPKAVLSKLVCPKVLNEYEPRLYSHAHGPFLDVAQRFLHRKPELIEKGLDYNDKKKQQNHYLKLLMENEQERTRLAAVKFGQQMQDEKDKENNSDDFDIDDDDYY